MNYKKLLKSKKFKIGILGTGYIGLFFTEFLLNLNRVEHILCIKNHNSKLLFNKSIKQYGTFFYIVVIIKFFIILCHTKQAVRNVDI